MKANPSTLAETIASTAAIESTGIVILPRSAMKVTNFDTSGLTGRNVSAITHTPTIITVMNEGNPY